MNIIFTICSNNYLAQARVLGESLATHVPEAAFVIVLVDKKSNEIDYTAIPFEVLPIAFVEPRIDELANKYDIVELNTCVKPRVFQYFFENRECERITYIDPDIRVYGGFAELERALDSSDMVLTPHILTPIPLDGKKPTENLFLLNGLYNLGFLAVKRSEETGTMLTWWKDRTYAGGYRRPIAGMFVDQLYMNLAPILFSHVAILRDFGYNMAPWNLHERRLDRDGDGGSYLVNGGSKLVFFHFSGHRVDLGEQAMAGTERFSPEDMQDLHALVAEYKDALKIAGYSSFSKIPCAYSQPPSTHTYWDWSIEKFRILGKPFAKAAVKQLPDSVKHRISAALVEWAKRLS
jgi:hypothetical protein